MRFQGVLFDMDGLLLDTERLFHDAFVATGDAFGLSDMSEVYIRTIGLRADENVPLIRAALDGRARYEDFNAHWDGVIAKNMAGGIAVKFGAAQLLAHLTVHGIPCAVATSTRTEKARHHLQDANLLQYFQVVIGGDQVERGKPDPAIYLKAAQKIGVSPEACVAFEDSDAGTRAAIASGAHTVQVPDMKQPGEDLRANGHIIAENLLIGAKLAGLPGDW